MVTVTDKNTLREDLAAVERLAASQPVCEALTELVRRRAEADMVWHQVVGVIVTMASALLLLLIMLPIGTYMSGFISLFVSGQSVFVSYGLVSGPSGVVFSWQDFVQIIIKATPFLALYLLPVMGAMICACSDVHIEKKVVIRESQR